MFQMTLCFSFLNIKKLKLDPIILPFIIEYLHQTNEQQNFFLIEIFCFLFAAGFNRNKRFERGLPTPDGRADEDVGVLGEAGREVEPLCQGRKNHSKTEFSIHLRHVRHVPQTLGRNWRKFCILGAACKIFWQKINLLF